MNKNFLKYGVILVLLSCVSASKAYDFSQSYQFDVFTSNGTYYDSSALDFSVTVSNSSWLGDTVDFKIYNNSLINSSMAGVYFDFGNLLDLSYIVNGPGVYLKSGAKPKELPAGNTLEPPFDSSDTFGTWDPTYHNGINPGEWLKISFDLRYCTDISNIIDGMNSGELRIGSHIIGLPDCSSESAVTVPVTVPEPMTICLLGLGSLSFICKKREGNNRKGKGPSNITSKKEKNVKQTN